MALLCSTFAFAAEQSIEGKAIFWQKLVSVNGQEMDQTYNYCFEGFADEAGEFPPMPDGSVDGKFYFTMTGDTSLPVTMTYTHAGVYKYKAYQQKPNPKEYYTYDNTVYDVEAYVKNTEGGGLEANYIFKNSNYEKVVDPGWTVTLDQPTPGRTPKTFDINYLFAGVGIGILLLIGILSIINYRRQKN